MTKELIINASGDGVEIALLEDKKLVELHYERGQDEFAVGGEFQEGAVVELGTGGADLKGRGGRVRCGVWDAHVRV